MMKSRRYTVKNIYDIGRESNHHTFTSAVKKQKRMTGVGWVIFDNDKKIEVIYTVDSLGNYQAI